MKKHKHTWVISHTSYDKYVNGGLYDYAEYAYLLCQCGKVVKINVKLIDKK